MAKKKSIPKKKISNNEPEDLTPQITWFYNPKYYPLEEDTNVSKVHIQLRELLKEDMDKWCRDFNKRAELATNFEEFINLNLSVCAITFNYQSNYVFPFRDFGLSTHYMRGYDSAIKGDNPFMDEIKVPGMGASEEMISQDLLDFMNGYYASLLDSYVMNFKKDDTAPINNKSNEEGDIILKYLHCLSGYWKDRQIMKKDEFNRLIEYARYTMENEQLPKPIKPIDKGLSRLHKLFYQQSVYLLWKELKREKGHKQSLWISFVTRVFSDQYKQTEHDISKSFSKYAGRYDNDKELITYK